MSEINRVDALIAEASHGALVEQARRIYRSLEMSANIMRDPKRTGGWDGARRTADAFDRQAIAAKQLHDALARLPAPPEATP